MPWARASGGKTKKHFTPAKQRSYMDAIQILGSVAMRGKKLFEGPLKASALFIYNGDDRGWKSSRADIDNLWKIFGDSLNGIVYKDDAQICVLHASKMFDKNERVEVLIEELEER